MLLDDVTYARQPQPGPADPPGDIGTSVEPLQDRGKIARRDPDPLVANGEHRPMFIGGLVTTHADRYQAAVRAELDGIGEEISKRPL